MDDHNKVVVREEAVDTEREYRNYYISEDLQEVIAALTGTQITCEGRYWSSTRSQQKAKSTPQQGVRRNPVRECREDIKRQRL